MRFLKIAFGWVIPDWPCARYACLKTAFFALLGWAWCYLTGANLGIFMIAAFSVTAYEGRKYEKSVEQRVDRLSATLDRNGTLSPESAVK